MNRFPRTDQAAPAGTRTRRELVAIGFAALVVSLSQTVLVPVIPELPRELDSSANTVSWLLTSTLLAGAVSVPIFGRLADMFGRRRLLIIALALMTVGSLITAASDQIAVLIVGRAVQGVSLAAIPLGISILDARMPRERSGSAIAVVSAMLGVGGALGLPLAGLVAERTDFHVLFWITAAAGFLACVAVITVLPAAESRPGGRVDVVGSVLLSAGVLCLLLPLAQAASWGWSSPATLALFAASILLLVVFTVTQLRTPAPLVNVRAVRTRPIMLTNAASALFGFALFASLIGTATFVVAPSASGYGFGASLTVGGLALLPSGLAMLLFSPVAARLTSVWGPSPTLALGALVVGLGWIMRIALSSTLAEVIVGTTIVGIGTGIGYAAIPTLIGLHTPPRDVASANGLNTLFRSLGSAIASAIGASVLAASSIVVSGVEFPSLQAYRVLFAIASASAVLAAALALLIPRRPHRPSRRTADARPAVPVHDRVG